MLALVVFTGVDTKLMMNSKSPPHKRSNVERRVNKYLVIVFTILFITASMSTTISILYTMNNEAAAEYFSGQDSGLQILNMITFLILYNSLVPISLYVTMDLVRVFQARFIQWDMSMYYPPADTTAIAKTGDLNEDLGQIEYIFTDKTGTLTENLMEFKRCSINGQTYGSIEPVQLNGQVSMKEHPKFKFFDTQLLADCKAGKKEVIEFLECLSLCHTVLPSGEEDDEFVQFQAASPDEEALVIASHCMGYSFINAHANFYSLEVMGERCEYKVFGINEFTSDRKRMSIVVQSISDPNRPPMLYCKGADNVMMERIIASPEKMDTLNRHLHEFSVQGLRTLVVGKKVLTKEQADSFETRWLNAKNAISDRQNRLELVAEEIESEMELLGATAIEDKIQEEVPETIATLMNAGIKVWVLTGDKQETAINIGYSCKLLKGDMELIKINIKSEEEAKSALTRALNRHVFVSDDQHENSVLRHIHYVDSSHGSGGAAQPGTGRSLKIVSNVLNEHNEQRTVDVESLNLGLVVDGQSLHFIMADMISLKYFTMLSSLCHAVICCRVSPLQKSEVVKLVKQHLDFKPLCLAIGDGANDVSMIQEAHVGIGICGQEGLQAANSSDYAIARFHYLLPLLLIHGRWNYQRVTMVTLYSFYKNFMLVLPMFYFSFDNMYSGTALYDSWLIMSFNVALTAFPIMVLGTLDQDLPRETILRNPSVYLEGIFSKRFNAKIFVSWAFMAILQSLLLYLIITNAALLEPDSNGHQEDLGVMGTVAFYAVVQTVSYMIMLNMKSWNKLFIIVMAVSHIAFLPYIAFWDAVGIPTSSMRGISGKIFSVFHMFACMALVPVMCILPNLFLRYMKAVFFPSEIDKLQKPSKYAIHPEEEVEIDQHAYKRLPLRAAQYSNKLNRIFNPKGLKLKIDEEEERSDYTQHNITLIFFNPYLEKAYKRYIVDRIIKFIRNMMIILFVLNAIWTIADLSANEQDSIIIVARIFVVIAVAGLVWLSRKVFFKVYYEQIILTIIITGLLAKFTLEVIAQNDGSMSQAMLPIITFVLFNISTYKVFIVNVVFNILYLIRVSITYGTQLDGVEVTVILMNYTSLLFGITFISAFVGYKIEKGNREEFVLRKKLEYQFQKGQNILSNLLPKFVKDRVAQGVRYIAKDQGTVTILFCDIYDFDNICATHSPQELIELLDKFFAVLDQLCDKFGVTKIETVGKTYMVCGGLKDSETHLSADLLTKNHAQRVVELGLEILKKLQNVYLKTGEKFRVKIGVNSGQVIAGVVGEHKPQFSLVGDTVNTASRMCSTIKVSDSMRISESTYNFVKESPWTFTYDQIEAKGKGMLNTYFVSQVVERRGHRRVTTFDQLVQAQQQSIPNTPEDLNHSHLPLVNNEAEGPDNDVGSQRDSQETQMGIEQQLEVMWSGEEDEYIGKAGPVQWLICSFKETPSQHEYRISYTERDWGSLKWGIVSTLAIYTIMTIIAIIGFQLSGLGSILQIGLRFFYLTMMLTLIIMLPRVYNYSIFPWAVMMIYILTNFINGLALYTMPDEFLYVIVLELMYTNVVINHISGLMFGFILTASVANITNWMCSSLKGADELSLRIEATFFLIIYMMINAAASYVREAQDRKTYNLTKIAHKTIQQTEKLLNQMMPPSVVKNLKKDIATTDKHSDITILFADICGFTAWSSDKTPIEVVSMLSKLFISFDHLCVKNNVYKVHTIGDCYVILSFTDTGEDEDRNLGLEIHNMINMALDMVKNIKKINRDKKMSLNMRIGLHTGELVAGITGTNIVRYDIYGPDVDIANKMESNSEAGRINVSEVTKNILEMHEPNRFDYIFNKTVYHEPVDRHIPCYFVKPKLSQDVEF